MVDYQGGRTVRPFFSCGPVGGPALAHGCPLRYLLLIPSSSFLSTGRWRGWRLTCSSSRRRPGQREEQEGGRPQTPIRWGMHSRSVTGVG